MKEVPVVSEQVISQLHCSFSRARGACVPAALVPSADRPADRKPDPRVHRRVLGLQDQAALGGLSRHLLVMTVSLVP